MGSNTGAKQRGGCVEIGFVYLRALDVERKFQEHGAFAAMTARVCEADKVSDRTVLSMIAEVTVTGRAMLTPSISWMPRWRTCPRARSVTLTCPPITSSSRDSSQAPAIAVTMLVSPAQRSPERRLGRRAMHSLKYSAAMPAATSCTTGMQVRRWLQDSSRCMMLPPATKKQCV